MEYDDLHNPWVGGGGSVRSRRLYREVADRSAGDVTVYAGRYPGARDETVDGVRYRYRGAREPYWWSRLTFSAWATRRLRRRDYDVAVYGVSPYTPVLTPRASNVVYMVHHLTGPSARERWGAAGGRVVEGIERLLLRRGRTFVVPSEWTRRKLEEVTGKRRTAVIPNGVEEELFELERREEDFLLFFGRVDVFQKGLDRLLRAVSILRGRGVRAPLKIAGRGGDVAELRRMAEEEGVGDVVEILGEVTDRRRNELFRTAKLLVMPSRFEGFGMVAAEAMAAGLPVVATAAGALPEVVRPDGGGGVVVEDPTPGGIADAIERLLRDESARRELQSRTREVVADLRWPKLAGRYLEVLRAAAEGRDGIGSGGR